MELFLKGRGTRITEQLRRTAAHKVGKLSRLDPRGVARLEIEVISERNPRQNGNKQRVEAELQTGRRTFRAKAQAADVELALDRLVDRLERQIRDYRTKRKNRLLGRSNRLKSTRIGPEGA
jgi:ribosomal subunit interface protein